MGRKKYYRNPRREPVLSVKPPELVVPQTPGHDVSRVEKFLWNIDRIVEEIEDVKKRVSKLENLVPIIPIPDGCAK